MTVTREPADRAEPGTDVEVSEQELQALEAAAEQARHDARRAAQAVRLARRSRGRADVAAPDPELAIDADDADADADADDAVATGAAVDLAKPAGRAAPVETADAVTADAVTADAETPTAADTADDGGADDASADDGDAASEGDDAPAKSRRRPRRVTVIATAAAVLAAVFVVVAVVVYANADDSRTTSPAAARDAALLAARQDIVVLNTLDFADVDGGLQRWLGATTGTLHDQLSQVSDADKQAIAVSKSVTTASVLAAAVTQVDATHGSATVLASVQIDVKPQTGTPTTKRTRFSLTMTRVGEAWKLSAVQQVGVTLS